MRLLKLIPRGRAHAVAATPLVALSLLACVASLAQSGRRQPPRQEIAPVPTPTPEPTPLPRVGPVEQKIPILVLANDANLFYQTSRETEAVHAVVVARLRESRSLEVSAEERRASRGDAVKRAKESGGRNVLWVELRTDLRYESQPRRPPPEYFRVEFTIFQPGTGKVLTSGAAQVRRQYGPLGRPTRIGCYPNSAYDTGFALAALEAAERVMESFSLTLPRRCG